MTAPPSPDRIVWTLPKERGELIIRRLETSAEYQACVALQEETWGKEFQDRVPPSILLVTQKIGGLTAGAFDREGSLVAFVFGMTGHAGGVPVHWSDMLAVRHSYRGLGIGARLKWFQRGVMLKQGVTTIFWTFDPLVARNAHLNLNVLGAAIDSYVPEMYVDSGSDMHRGLGMDRCIIAWHIASPRVESLAAGTAASVRVPARPLPVVNTEPDSAGRTRPAALPPVTAAEILVEVPPDIERVRDSSHETARAWRESTRRAFLHYLGHGYHVSSFFPSPDRSRFYYLLASHRQ